MGSLSANNPPVPSFVFSFVLLDEAYARICKVYDRVYPRDDAVAINALKYLREAKDAIEKANVPGL